MLVRSSDAHCNQRLRESSQRSIQPVGIFHGAVAESHPVAGLDVSLALVACSPEAVSVHVMLGGTPSHESDYLAAREDLVRPVNDRPGAEVTDQIQPVDLNVPGHLENFGEPLVNLVVVGVRPFDRLAVCEQNLHRISFPSSMTVTITPETPTR